MSSDDSFRNPQYSGNRKTNSKAQGYSPSTNYNYGNQNQHGSHNNSHGNHTGHGNYGTQQQQRRKNTNFKQRDNHGVNDRIIKQNDIIIRLLKEIRDRLPANGTAPTSDKEENYKGRRTAGKQAATQMKSEAQVDSNTKLTSTQLKKEEQSQEVTDSLDQANSAANEPEMVPAESEDDVLDSAVNGNLK